MVRAGRNLAAAIADDVQLVDHFHANQRLDGNAGQANYVASKAGLVGLTKTAAKELAGRGITVNAIAPGFIETDMTAALSDKVREAMLSTVPLGRAGTPEDVAAAVMFLASPKADFITGEILDVNGGFIMD